MDDLNIKIDLLSLLFFYKIINKDPNSYFYFDFKSNVKNFNSGNYFKFPEQSEEDLMSFYIAIHLPVNPTTCTLKNNSIFRKNLHKFYNDQIVFKIISTIIFSQYGKKESVLEILKANELVINKLRNLYLLYASDNRVYYKTFDNLLSAYQEYNREEFNLISKEILNESI